MTSSQISNSADQIKLSVAPLLDRQLLPLGLRAIAHLALTQGDNVADIGCGTGQTCLQLADAVGPTGAVLGIDISPAMTAAAKERTGSIRQITITLGDAQHFGFTPSSFDAVYSRFGVMFFSDPVQAFTNLHRALKKNGKLAFVCWRRLEENHLDNIPLKAALPYLPPNLLRGLGDTAPFSFSSPTRVRQILTDAGFQNIQIERHNEAVSSGNLDSMLELALSVGTLGKIIRENAEFRTIVSAPVKAALEADGRQNGYALDAAVWIVSAHA